MTHELPQDQNKNQPPTPEQASQDEMRGLFERAREFVFQGGEALCDVEATLSGQYSDPETGELVPMLDLQPHYTLPSIKGSKVIEAGEQETPQGELARKAVEILKLGSEDTLEFGYASACMVVDPADGSSAPEPAHLTFSVQKPYDPDFEGTPTEEFGIYAEEIGSTSVLESFYARDFEGDRPTVTPKFDAGTLALERMFAGDEHDLTEQEEADIKAASTTHGRSEMSEVSTSAEVTDVGIAVLRGEFVTSDDVKAMHAVFGLVPPNLLPESPDQQ